MLKGSFLVGSDHRILKRYDDEKAMTAHEIEQEAFSQPGAAQDRASDEETAGPPVAANKAKTKRKAR
jgi:hypothetical protein